MKKKWKATTVFGGLLLLSLALSLVYSLVRMLLAPDVIPEGEPLQKVKADYLLMLVECLLGLLVMMLPTLIKRRWRFVVPSTAVILYYVFLYCAICLGEVRNFYYVIPHWDTILHAFSGAMLGALGFVLVDLLNKERDIRVKLSPFFVSLFAFSFALALGALWEIYEFTIDAVLGLNMQRHMTEAGAPLSGTAALADTMKDIIVDAIAALTVTVIGSLTSRKKAKITKDEASIKTEGEE